MTTLLESYARIAGEDVIDHLYQLSRQLKGIRVVHINSTLMGGGVAEILHKLIPLMRELGMDTDWKVVTGNDAFFGCTKSIHNGLQGNIVPFTANDQKVYETTNVENAEKLRGTLEGLALRLAAERGVAPARLGELQRLLEGILRRAPHRQRAGATTKVDVRGRRSRTLAARYRWGV